MDCINLGLIVYYLVSNCISRN